VLAKLASDQGSAVRNFIDELLDRFDDLKNWGWRRRRRGWVTAQGIAFSILLGTLLTLGIVAAWAVPGSDAETSYTTPSTTPLVSSSITSEVVTETIKRNGKAIRIVHRRTLPGNTVLETVPGRGTTLPARTVRETHTVTTREVATVTETQSVTVTVQPETVTIIETVTCKPKSC
jgi:hypothetical protein